MKLPFDLPFREPPQSNVLLLGAGGGYDVVCTLPIAVALRDAGCRIHLASYSTTDFSGSSAIPDVPTNLLPVDSAYRRSSSDRFSEDIVARWWLETFAEEKPVWCFTRPGVRSMSTGLAWLRKKLDLTAVVVVDGGVDGLFIGNEYDLGTPSMDAISIIAAWTLEDCRKYYAFTAFGTEGPAYHIRHADVLKRISELVRHRAMLGVSALLPLSHAGDLFLDALEFIGNAVDPIFRSIISSSIECAMRGGFGETNLTPRTDWAPVWVSPLTLLYWYFDLVAVANAKPYLREVLDTDDVVAVAEAIERTRKRMGVVDRQDIPI